MIEAIREINDMIGELGGDFKIEAEIEVPYKYTLTLDDGREITGTVYVKAKIGPEEVTIKEQISQIKEKIIRKVVDLTDRDYEEVAKEVGKTR